MVPIDSKEAIESCNQSLASQVSFYILTMYCIKKNEHDFNAFQGLWNKPEIFAFTSMDNAKDIFLNPLVLHKVVIGVGHIRRNVKRQWYAMISVKFLV